MSVNFDLTRSKRRVIPEGDRIVKPFRSNQLVAHVGATVDAPSVTPSVTSTPGVTK